MNNNASVLSEQDNYLNIKDGNYYCMVEDCALYAQGENMDILDIVVKYFDPEDGCWKNVIAKYYLSLKSRTTTLLELFVVLSQYCNDCSISMSNGELKEKCNLLKNNMFILNVKSKVKNDKIYKDLRLKRR